MSPDSLRGLLGLIAMTGGLVWFLTDWPYIVGSLIGPISLCVSVLALTSLMLISKPLRRWFDQDLYSQAIDIGKNELKQEQFLQAALYFKTALAYYDTPSASLGLAIALEGLGDVSSALDKYGHAAFILPMG